VIPRYASPQYFEGGEFLDGGWPGQPALQTAVTLAPGPAGRLKTAIASCWPADAA